MKDFDCLKPLYIFYWACSCLQTAKMHLIVISCPQILQVVWSGFVHAWTRHLELSSPPQHVHFTGCVGRRGISEPDSWPGLGWLAAVSASRSLENWGRRFCESRTLSSKEATLMTGFVLIAIGITGWEPIITVECAALIGLLAMYSGLDEDGCDLKLF